MKPLNEILKKDNAIHATIHHKDRKIFEDNTIVGLQKADEESIKAVRPMHEALSKHYDLKHHPALGHFLDYTNNSYEVNSALWKTHKNQKPTSFEAQAAKAVPHLDAGLKTHKTPRRFTTYSGVRYDPREKMNEENVVHHPAYLSTSLRKDVATGFAQIQHGHEEDSKDKHVLAIDIPKGHHGSYLGSHSLVPEEHEFILPRGTNLKHKETTSEKIKHPIYGDVTVHTHKMSIV